MLDVMSIPAIPQEKPRRLVVLRRDEMDFVVAFQPEESSFEIQMETLYGRFASRLGGRS